MLKILNFYKYEKINNDYIKKSIEYNSKDFIEKFYKYKKMGRFTNQNKKEEIKVKIENYVDEIINDKFLIENFNKLFKL